MSLLETVSDVTEMLRKADIDFLIGGWWPYILVSGFLAPW